MTNPLPDPLPDPAPLRADAGLVYIGRVRTPWASPEECPRNSMESDALCTVEIDPPYDQALASLETCSHVILLYWLNQAKRDRLVQHPPMDDRPHGAFALRTPNRPNPIGLAVADLVAVQGHRLTVRHVDCVDGTPLLDIKPYFASTDAKPDARVGWHERRARPLPPRG